MDDAITRREHGDVLLAKRNGGKPLTSFEAVEKAAPFVRDAISSFAAAEIFARPALDPKTQEIAMMAAFAALGLDRFLKVHAGYALNLGASPDELREIANLTIITAGIPRAVEAGLAIADVIEAAR